VTLDSPAAMAAVKTMMEGIDGVQDVRIGVPRSLPFQASVFLAGAGDDAKPRVTETITNEFAIRIHFGYRVAENMALVEEAELQLLAFKDALIRAHWANKKLGGVVEDSRLDFSPSRSAEYEVRAGQEWRIYPVDLLCKQSESFDASQP
jgi:hypothetical protein